MRGFQAPEGNTGAISQKCGIESVIDWLQGTFPESRFQEVSTSVSSALKGDSFTERQFGTRFYERSFKSSFGAVIATNPRQGGKVQGRTDAYLELSGSCLAHCDFATLSSLFIQLRDLGFRPSRLDLALDDFDKSYRPVDAFEAYSAGNVVGFRGTGNWIQSGPPDQLATTFSLGRRGKSGGGKFLQFYDKFLQSNGERDCIRAELSLYRDFAQQAFSILADAPVEFWPEIIVGYISGSCDFRDRSCDLKTDRCPRLSFWHNLIGDYEKIKPFRAAVRKSFERAKRWIQKAVAPTLSMLCEAISIDSGSNLGWDEFLLSSLFEGAGRLNDSHIAILNQVRHSTSLKLGAIP